MRPFILFAVLGLAVSANAGPFDAGHKHGDDDAEEAPFKLSGLLDLRYAYTGKAQSSFQGGTSKLRYGGRDIDSNNTGDRRASSFAVSQASIVLDAPVPSVADVHVQLNVDSDPNMGTGAVGLVEGYARTVSKSSAGTFVFRAGALIPPVSWEHPENAWSTHYTLTPSMIGSWIGEDLRVVGAEASFERAFGSHSARVTGAVFGGGDNIGWVLANRGWAMHDYQANLNTTLPVAPPAGGGPDQPFREFDGRAGYYGRLNLSLFDSLVKVGGGYFDNRGDSKADDQSGPATWNWPWHTFFYDYGAKFEWRRLSLIAQLLHGDTQNQFTPKRTFQSYYGLAAYHLPKGVTVSGRYDYFKVTTLEKGSAMTADLQWDMNARQRVSAEYIEIKAKPNLLTAPKSETDRLFQLNWRVKFG